MNTKDIKSFSLHELTELMIELNQPTFRAKQLFHWLYARSATSYDEMTNLPAALRNELSKNYPLREASVVDRQVSEDGTRKYVIEFHNGARVETVALPSSHDLMHSTDRLAVCFSTQVGCGMQCSFCATGKEGFTRNLTSGEIIDQIMIVQADFPQTRVSSLVAMGQGEPFLNYDNTLSALRIANSADAFNIGARHITISTCGIISGIEYLTAEPEQFTLAVSLHSGYQPVRDDLMPTMASTPLSDLKTSLKAYNDLTNRRVTLEYLMIDGINDTRQALASLQSFCKGIHCHINLLPMNAVDESPYRPSTHAAMNYWMTALNAAGIETTTRQSRGSDIAGACGQLKNSLY